MCTALPHHTVYQSHLLLWRGKRITCRLHGDVVMHFAGDESITLELQIRESYFRSRTGALIFECRSRLCSMLMRTTFFFVKKKKKGQLTVLASFQAATDTFGRNKETK